MDTVKLTKLIDEKLNTLSDKSNYKAFMSIISNFHQYSFANQMLIYIQSPDATRIAGYNTWETKFKRHIIKGADGIRLIAPKYVTVYVHKSENRLIKYNEMTREELAQALQSGIVERRRAKKGSIGITVYDLLQTEGQDMPAIPKVIDIKDTNKFSKLVEEITGSKVELMGIMPDTGIANSYNPKTNKITSGGTDNEELIKAIMHGAAISLTQRINAASDIYPDNYTGWERDDTEMLELAPREAQVLAESVYATILNHIGIPNNYDYIEESSWVRDNINSIEGKARIRILIEYISKIAIGLLTAIDKVFEVKVDPPEENNDITVKEELAEELLTTMEANAARIRHNGGVVV